LSMLQMNLGALGNTIFVQGAQHGLTSILNAGTSTAANTVMVNATGDSSMTVVNGNTGHNTDKGSNLIQVGNVTANSSTGLPLRMIQGMVSVDPMGGSGSDTLMVDNRADTADETGTLTQTEVMGLGMKMGIGIEYNHLSMLHAKLGDGHNDFTIADTHTAT